MAIYLMRNILEKEKNRNMYCLPFDIDPNSLSAAIYDEVEVIPPKEEWEGDTPPEPVKMRCLARI